MDELQRRPAAEMTSGSVSEAIRELAGGGGVNWDRILSRIPEGVSGAERAALQGAAAKYIRDQVIYGQIQNLRGCEAVMDRLAISDITMSEDHLRFIQLFTERVTLTELVSFVMRVTGQVRPGETPIDERAEARAFLNKRFSPEVVDDGFVQTFLDLDQFLVKLMDHRRIDLANVPLTQLPRLLASS